MAKTPWQTAEDARSLVVRSSDGALYVFPYLTLDHAVFVGGTLTISFGAGIVSVTLESDEIVPRTITEDIAESRISLLEHKPDEGFLVHVDLKQDEDDATETPGV